MPRHNGHLGIGTCLHKGGRLTIRETREGGIGFIRKDSEECEECTSKTVEIEKPQRKCGQLRPWHCRIEGLRCFAQLLASLSLSSPCRHPCFRASSLVIEVLGMCDLLLGHDISAFLHASYD